MCNKSISKIFELTIHKSETISIQKCLTFKDNYVKLTMLITKEEGISMKENINTQTKGHGILRKTHSGLASGIMFGTAACLMFASTTAFADTTNPTNSNSSAVNTPSESRPGVPADLDKAVNEDFVKQFPYGERFTDEDGIPATRTKAPDIELRFKPKGYEKEIIRKINYRVKNTGATISRIYQNVRYYGTYEYEIPKDAPVNEISDADVPVVSEKGTPEVHEKPEFNGGVTPLDPPVLNVPEYNAPIGISGTPEVHEKPEFNGGVIPLDPPVLEVPKIEIVDTPEKPEPNKPTVSVNQKNEVPPTTELLPNTGVAENNILQAIGLGLLSSFGLVALTSRKKQD